MREEEYRNILKTIVWCYLIFFLQSPKCAQIQFWCVFFHISQAQEEEGDREEEIEKFQAVMLSLSKRLHCWPFQHLNASAHNLPWLPLCLPPPQNSNFEILKQCINVPLHISSQPLHHVFRVLNASKTLIFRFWNVYC